LWGGVGWRARQWSTYRERSKLYGGNVNRMKGGTGAEIMYIRLGGNSAHSVFNAGVATRPAVGKKAA